MLGQINYVQPALSPLLTKAVSIHGGSDAGAAQGTTDRSLSNARRMAALTLATNPQLQERAGAAVVPPPAAASGDERSVFAETKTETPPPPSRFDAESAAACRCDGREAVGRRRRYYDPSEFNRQAHPERDTMRRNRKPTVAARGIGTFRRL